MSRTIRGTGKPVHLKYGIGETAIFRGIPSCSEKSDRKRRKGQKEGYVGKVYQPLG